MHIDITIELINEILNTEQEQGSVNGLDDLRVRMTRRATLTRLMAEVQAVLDPIQHAVDVLPALPPETEIQWAQAVLAMENLRFMELDTTGLSNTDDIIRFTLLNRMGTLVEDVLIKPSTPLSEEV